MARTPKRTSAKKRQSPSPTKKSGVTKPIVMDPELAKKKLEELARDEIVLDGFDLRDVGAKYALPVVHLAPGAGKVVAKFHCDEFAMAIDMRVHPDPALRSSSILVVGSDTVELIAGGSLDVIEGGTQLTGRPATDIPEIDALLLEASELLPWVRQLHWKPEWGFSDDFEGATAAKEYDEAWRAEHPLFKRGADKSAVWAQLGGWPITWDDERYEEQQELSLVLRTYAHSEPWLEVFKDPAGAFRLCERIT